MKHLKRILSLAVSLVIVTAFTGCESGAELRSNGTARIAVTDAAVDAENITGVFLSVDEIHARSGSEMKTVAVFDSPKTFNLMDYQNGSTYSLGEGELAAGTYSEIRFILNGESYVAFNDGSTKQLVVPSGTSSGYKVKGDFEIASEGETELVADIDLRKALVVQGNDEYTLRPTARLVTVETTGTIEGTISSGNEDQLVIYAYKKGTFSESEADEPAEGSTRFEGSVNSAVVSNGSFTLAFMEEGEYELIAAGYDFDESAESFHFKSATQADFMLNGNLINVVQVKANSSANLLLDLNL